MHEYKFEMLDSDTTKALREFNEFMASQVDSVTIESHEDAQATANFGNEIQKYKRAVEDEKKVALAPHKEVIANTSENYDKAINLADAKRKVLLSALERWFERVNSKITNLQLPATVAPKYKGVAHQKKSRYTIVDKEKCVRWILANNISGLALLDINEKELARFLDSVGVINPEEMGVRPEFGIKLRWTGK